MKQKKWLISVCAVVGLLILCVGVHTVSKQNADDAGSFSGAALKENGAPDRSDTAQTGADLPDGSFEAVSVWVNGSGSAGDNFYLAALNSEKLAVSSVQHLPVFRFEAPEELETFKERFSDDFAMEHRLDERIPSFVDATSEMDETYFGGRTVFVVYVPASSGSFRFGVSSIYKEVEALCIHIEETEHPENGTDDMAGWFVVVSLEKALVADVTDVDADLGCGQSPAA